MEEKSELWLQKEGCWRKIAYKGQICHSRTSLRTARSWKSWQLQRWVDQRHAVEEDRRRFEAVDLLNRVKDGLPSKSSYLNLYVYDDWADPKAEVSYISPLNVVGKEQRIFFDLSAKIKFYLCETNNKNLNRTSKSLFLFIIPFYSLNKHYGSCVTFYVLHQLV